MLENKLELLKVEYIQVLNKRDAAEIRRVQAEIQQTVKEIEIAKGDEIIQRAKESGILSRTSQIISLVHLMMCEVNNLLSEVEDNFQKAQIFPDNLYFMQREYYKAADLYFKEFAKVVEHNNKGNDMFRDLEGFDNMIRIFAELKDMPKPVTLMGGCNKAASKANGLSHMCQKCMMTPNPESIMCIACSKSFREGFHKGAKWLEKKRIERIMKKDKEDSNEKDNV